MFDLDEILIYLKTNFPLCEWKLEKFNGEPQIAWRPTQRFKVYLTLGNFHKSHLNGCQFISVNWETHESGNHVPCSAFVEFEIYLKKAISDFNPKLLEGQQLTLF